ncbi:GNAT family N-acetyltransferase [Ruminococcaceae bacterium OttesenSCG-928-I18]|nr:GNAT family N-acetyltransferase [Ruminococcaceae bacterium OttesenSCG-928-I18]
MEDLREHLVIRQATREDAGLIVEMVQCLAEAEKRSEDMTGTEEGVRTWMFDRGMAHAELAWWDGDLAGMLLYYPMYNSFSAEGTLHVEDIIVKPGYRGRGIGRILMEKAASLAVQQGYPTVDWACLSWNEDSLNFYKSLGGRHNLTAALLDFSSETTRELAEKYERARPEK